jgi:hypothetical protein
MVVPVLGRMTDSDDEIRSTATNTFASLVKMVPLEVSAFIPPAFISKKILTNLTMTQAGLPDPPGFSDDLFKRRDTEREFLNQLLDGSKVEQYTLPVTIKADLRKYQQDGVNWLAFLAKYQLHGILCDGMTCFVYISTFSHCGFRYGPRKNSSVDMYFSKQTFRTSSKAPRYQFLRFCASSIPHNMPPNSYWPLVL